MRARLLLMLALAAAVTAQDTTDATDATPTDTSGGGGGGGGDDNTDGLTPASDTGTPTSIIDMPPTLPSGPWNITYFIAPTRNNYWVNDNDNTAAWAPVNVATNLILSNSNSSVLPQPILLVQNLAPGTANYKSRISGLIPSNNYIVALTLAGNPDQKLAQTQGFHIKPNSTAAIQQVTGIPATGTPVGGVAAGTAAPGSPGAPGATAAGAPAGAASDGNPIGNPAGTVAAASSAGRVGAGVAVVLGVVAWFVLL